jgi:RimJ/RimL family protein N-acetyltransferase
MSFQNPHIAIRPFSPEDAEPLFRMVLAQGRDLDSFSWRCHIARAHDELAFIHWASAAEESHRAFSRAILVEGQLSGCASLYSPHPGCFDGWIPKLPIRLQMGYWVDQKRRGAGASWKAMALLMKQASESFPDDSLAALRTRTRNMASQTCAAKLGLKPIQHGLPSRFDPGDTDMIFAGPLSLEHTFLHAPK